MEPIVQSQTKMMRESLLPFCIEGFSTVRASIDDILKSLQPFIKTPCKRVCTPMVLTLAYEGRVLMQMDVWYLVLSAILRQAPPFSLSQALRESMLTARIEFDGEEHVFGVPQPPEFTEDSDECPNMGSKSG